MWRRIEIKNGNKFLLVFQSAVLVKSWGPMEFSPLGCIIEKQQRLVPDNKFWSFFFYYFLNYFNFFIVVQVQLSPFSPHHSPPSQPSSLPTLNPTPLWFCPCVLYTCSWKPLPLFLPLAPPTSLLVTVSLFFISMSLILPLNSFHI